MNAAVYGIASDGISFRFCRVNNDGVFSISAPLDWRMDGHKERIFSMIRKIMRTAMLSSPSTTPIRDPARRQLVLAPFSSPSAKVDFGIELFEVGEEEEEGDFIIIGGGRALGGRETSRAAERGSRVGEQHGVEARGLGADGGRGWGEEKAGYGR